MRKIKVCPGIGDNIWLLMKLINSGEKFHFQIADGKPRRGKQIFDLLPQVAGSSEYTPGFNYKKLARLNIQRLKPRWSFIKDQEFALSCNEHLEAGKRLEAFLPDLPTSFRIPWDTDLDHLEAAEALLPGWYEGGNYIGIYGSAYSTARSWGFWDEHKWLKLIQAIYGHWPGYKFVIIGAEWDTDLGRNLMALLDAQKIPYVNTIGQPLGVVIEILKRLNYFFAFPSGLGILAPTVSCPVTMFYPLHLKKMINAWASPEDIETGLYKGCQFCEPEVIFKWAVQNRKI